MKSYKNLYKKLCSYENLELAFKKARRRKPKKPYVRRFEKNLNKELCKLQNELENFAYSPRQLKKFIIRDPKTRVIHASAFRDRVVHHALCNIIEPIFEKIFISDSFASRKDKGTHAAIKRFDKFKRKVSKNGKLVKNASDNNMVIGYVLKADIKHYFNTVDHEILFAIIKKKIKDENVLSLIRKTLDNFDAQIKGKGMPLGNLTSQFFANVFLNELDHFVKQELKVKFYMRYVDDFVILHRDKAVLESYIEEIVVFLKKLKLELHQQKSKIFPLYNGVSFLGYRVFYYYKLLRKSNLLKFEKSLSDRIILLQNKEITKESVVKSIQGWFGYAMWANTYKVRREIMEKINESHAPYFLFQQPP